MAPLALVPVPYSNLDTKSFNRTPALVLTKEGAWVLPDKVAQGQVARDRPGAWLEELLMIGELTIFKFQASPADCVGGGGYVSPWVRALPKPTCPIHRRWLPAFVGPAELSECVTLGPSGRFNLAQAHGLCGEVLMATDSHRNEAYLAGPSAREPGAYTISLLTATTSRWRESFHAGEGAMIALAATRGWILWAMRGPDSVVRMFAREPGRRPFEVKQPNPEQPVVAIVATGHGFCVQFQNGQIFQWCDHDDQFEDSSWLGQIDPAGRIISSKEIRDKRCSLRVYDRAKGAFSHFSI